MLYSRQCGIGALGRPPFQRAHRPAPDPVRRASRTSASRLAVFLVGQKLSRAELRRPFERHAVFSFARPLALEIGIAPQRALAPGPVAARLRTGRSRQPDEMPRRGDGEHACGDRPVHPSIHVVTSATASLLMSFTLRGAVRRRANYRASVFRPDGQRRGKSRPLAGDGQALLEPSLARPLLHRSWEGDMRRQALASGVVAAAVIAAACSQQTEQRAEEAGRATGAAVESAAGDAVRNAERAGEAATDAVREASNNTDVAGAAQAAIETVDVKAALMADKRVDASEINVDTDHKTKTVTLKGYVPSTDQRMTAEEIAREKAAGYTINNLLMVKETKAK